MKSGYSGCVGRDESLLDRGNITSMQKGGSLVNSYRIWPKLMLNGGASLIQPAYIAWGWDSVSALMALVLSWGSRQSPKKQEHNSKWWWTLWRKMVWNEGVDSYPQGRGRYLERIVMEGLGLVARVRRVTPASTPPPARRHHYKLYWDQISSSPQVSVWSSETELE